MTVTATGTLAPINQVDVGSELSGIVRTVAVDENDRVRAGQILATLDTTKLEAQRNQIRAGLAAARAGLNQADATLNETQAQFTRTRELSARQLSSQSDLDTARAAYERAVASRGSAAAEVAQSEAALRATQTDLSKRKSTCMNILGCLDTPTAGEYLFAGVDLARLSRRQRALFRRHYLGFVFQGYNLLSRTSALENVELPLVYRRLPAARRLGSNLLMIMPDQQGGPGQAGVTPFKVADADAIAREVAGVAAVAPTASRSLTAIAGNANWTTQATGTTNAMFSARNWSFAAISPPGSATISA